MPAISFQSVSKTYSTARGSFQALDAVSFDIEEGEFFGLLGPNGAGKTTLISILAGLVRASAGRVLVKGHDVQQEYGSWAARPRSRAAGTLAQAQISVVGRGGLRRGCGQQFVHAVELGDGGQALRKIDEREL